MPESETQSPPGLPSILRKGGANVSPKKSVRFPPRSRKQGRRQNRAQSTKDLPEPRFEKLERRLSTSEQRSSKAKETLNRLHSPTCNAVEVPVWSGDTENGILGANLNTLFSSSRILPEHEVDETLHSRAETARASSKASVKSPSSLLRASFTPGASSTPRKRSSSASTIDSVMSGTQNSDTQRRVKRLKLSRAPELKQVVDLAQLAPQALRISYKSHPLEDRTDEWYVSQFMRLFRQVEQFCRHFFGKEDLRAGQFFQPWLSEMTPEFITWAEQVAEGDDNLGSWDALLLDPEQRIWLIMGIVMKILRIKVFDVDLFGKSDVQGELLSGLDRALLSKEGFQRTELRAASVRTILGRNPVTVNFYDDVAMLTAQISLLLKPLSDYLNSLTPTTSGLEATTIEKQYQALHNLVSNAAYQSLCIRLSPTIFYFTEASLGAAYDAEDQYNLDMEQYSASKQAVFDIFAADKKQWLAKLDVQKKVMKRFEEKGTHGTKAGKKAVQLFVDISNAEPREPGHTHRPMVKISVSPGITRYKPGSDADDELGSNKALQDKDGFRILQIGKSATVCYFGREDRQSKLTLRRFLDAKKKKFDVRDRGLGKIVANFGSAFVIAGATWFYRDYLLENLGQYLESGLANVF